jgi:hypothetical protein
MAVRLPKAGIDTKAAAAAQATRAQRVVCVMPRF